MSSKNTFQNEYEFDLKDLIWKLLAQWKALLLVCIIMALLIPGAKYLKDLTDYDKDVIEKETAEKESAMTADERMEKLLENISEEDAETIHFILNQQNAIDQQSYYLNNSILVNTDPTSQKVVEIIYLVRRNDNVDLQVLVDTYSSCLRRTESLNALRDVIAPDAPLESILELLNSSGGTIADSDTGSVIYTVQVVIPEDISADDVVSAVDSIIKGISQELKSSVGSHSIVRLDANEQHQYNGSVSDRRTSGLYAINNLTNSIISAKGRLSEENVALVEKLIEIKQQEKELSETATNVAEAEAANTNNSEISAPKFSKRFIVFGFIFGAFLYVGVFLLTWITRKTLGSVSAASCITDKRLLGEAYFPIEHKLGAGLFYSETINKLRYKNKLDTEKQVKAAANTVEAVCNHRNVEKLTMLACDVSEKIGEVTDQIVKSCITGGSKAKIDIMDANAMDERAFSSISHAIYIVSNKTNVDMLRKMSSLCREYDVDPLGVIYLEEV